VSTKVRELLSAKQIQSRVVELGAEISRDYQGRDLVLIGVLQGSFIFLADLCRAISVPLTIDFLGLRSYGNQTESSGVVQITSDLARPIEGKDVLIVEDIVDTGLTMEYLIENLRTRLPRSLKLCALLHKPSRSVRPVSIDYLGHTIPDVFVVGYGLDYGQRFRNLPFIGVVE
jgi:hypoxanthine phosphoribosyltransferase